MHIQEAEDKTGLTWANIRFYEGDTPQPQDSGCRDCSREDVDGAPPEPHPWRRWMARGADILLINAGLLLVWCVFLHHFFQRVSSFWLTVAVLVLLFLLEPVFLPLWGTTPGKWIMGISIRDEGGGKPSWSQAWLRTWGVLRWGLGFSVPLYNLYRGYRSYRMEQAGERALWDDSAGTMVCFRDDRLWRPLAAVGAWCLLFGCIAVIGTASLLPPNRGDLTVEEFVENYQWYADQLDMGTWQLQPSGEFVWEGSNAFSVLEPESLAPLRWMEEDGILTGISLEMGQEERWAGDICVEESNSYSPTAQTLASLALVGARAPLFSARDLLNQVLAWGVEVDTGSLTLAGVTLARETELEGWKASGGDLFRADGAENCRMAMDVTLTVG